MQAILFIYDSISEMIGYKTAAFEMIYTVSNLFDQSPS